MISRIFIDRPIFAWVIAIVIMLLGTGGLLSLPVSQYPNIAPPSVNIRANYPGASADTVESNITQIIEQQLSGIDGLLYFSSSSSSAGRAQITVTFDKGVDPDIAQVQVQNKVQQALPRLPQQVQQQGLVVTKSNPDFLMVVSVYDESGRSTNLDVADYLTSTLQDGIGRLPGVGDVNVFGAPYAMRIWLDPYKLASFGLTPDDVTSALQAQNAQIAAGQIGGVPSSDQQMLNAIVTSRSRLTNADEFKKILVKTQVDGSKVLLQDVARVELGSESYNIVGRLNGHPGAGIAILLAPGADALKTSELVRTYVDEAAGRFPPGYRHVFVNDATAFIKLSIEEVVKTLFEAILLVVLVMFVFLQSWRATLIPAIAVPVVLLGTFGVLAAAGFSINTLTLFSLVLAIGLLVDDAIVVVENVERVMEEDPDISPREAAIKSMAEINTALIAIALVLSAVFLPMAFFGGSTGVIYRQFSITIVASMALSVFVALVLSPALAATLLKRPDREKRAAQDGLIGRAYRFGDRFNIWFRRLTDRYIDTVSKLFGRTRTALIVFVLLVFVLALVFLRLPTGFVPTEDQGFAQTQYTLAPGATMSRTVAVAREIEAYMAKNEAANVQTFYTVSGTSSGGQGQNTGRGFLALAPWDERKGTENSAESIAHRATQALSSVRDAQIFILTPPSIPGLGQSTGFSMELLNSGNLSRTEFKARRDQLLAAASADPELANIRLDTLEDTPTLAVDIDSDKVGALGVSQASVNQTLSAAWGGQYVNDFVDRGRVKRVFVQGDAPFRSRPEDLAAWHVRSSSGEMVPFSAFAKVHWAQTPNVLTRFNGVANFTVQGQGAPGKSSGDAMKRITELAAEIPGVSVDWSGLSYQERLSGGQAPILYGLSILVVFLCLAGLYESWSIPVAVVMVIPLGLIGATLAVLLRGLENDVFFQVGLVTTMGLSAKNAILIVEFAVMAENDGKTPLQAAIDGARIRLRPILMTSFAFMFGVLPLAISTGAGAKARVAIGTAVLGGMFTATLLAIFFVPLFFVLVRKLFPRKRGGEVGV
ncbi:MULTISPECIES: efflux RND transporter permease subunit [unclassified Sphingomonas]|uniref:efflux RND transporter permease subunit n=1 Tax=unclassified Sphingomonas TaxID=196159 RepID=UPI0006FB2A95|nr:MULTISPECIES: efflux RND transporter permease subunit [unclassified Sphingomonas]KQX17740.1 multidrug transporter [Sphingomonas sp. Root1294]KQY70666.1 multidrug transporter [Sphingomonas sp. Root50]KRB91842.1 multidrug transporter [Sphingomonas sp. Root720]